VFADDQTRATVCRLCICSTQAPLRIQPELLSPHLSVRPERSGNSGEYRKTSVPARTAPWIEEQFLSRSSFCSRLCVSCLRKRLRSISPPRPAAVPRRKGRSLLLRSDRLRKKTATELAGDRELKSRVNPAPFSRHWQRMIIVLRLLLRSGLQTPHLKMRISGFSSATPRALAAIIHFPSRATSVDCKESHHLSRGFPGWLRPTPRWARIRKHRTC